MVNGYKLRYIVLIKFDTNKLLPKEKRDLKEDPLKIKRGAHFTKTKYSKALNVLDNNVRQHKAQTPKPL